MMAGRTVARPFSWKSFNHLVMLEKCNIGTCLNKYFVTYPTCRSNKHAKDLVVFKGNRWRMLFFCVSMCDICASYSISSSCFITHCCVLTSRFSPQTYRLNIKSSCWIVIDGLITFVGRNDCETWVSDDLHEHSFIKMCYFICE